MRLPFFLAGGGNPHCRRASGYVAGISVVNTPAAVKKGV